MTAPGAGMERLPGTQKGDVPFAPGRRLCLAGRDQARSKRSSSITFAHAATKSLTKASFASSAA